jgi:glyoxylase-like metal-dependent hydrolase (beta-lactamase superfamily II)
MSVQRISTSRSWARQLRALGTLRVLLVLPLAVALSPAHAQRVDVSKVEIKTTRLAPNFYTLEGEGGTIGVLTGPDGVFMVDAQFKTLAPRIEAAIKRVSNLPIRYLVNTHVHIDHTNGNDYFGNLGATIVARPEVRERLIHPGGGNAREGSLMPAIGLPTLLYQEALTFWFDGQEIRLIAVPHAHTDGDTLVYFPGLDLMMTGDFYRSVQYPNIDRAQGGSLQGLLDALGLVIGRAGPATKIIPGHGPVVDRTAVAAQRDLVLTVRDRIAALVAQGKSEDQVVAAKVTADLDAHVQEPGTSGEKFIRQMYQELAAAH